MIKLKRSRLHSGTPGIAITARANLIVSPSWTKLVGPYKSGTISAFDYYCTYMDHLEKNMEKVLDWALELNHDTTFLCFCHNGQFCHTHILIKFLVEIAPESFEYAPGYEDNFSGQMEQLEKFRVQREIKLYESIDYK
jgi:hypothetical protein